MSDDSMVPDEQPPTPALRPEPDNPQLEADPVPERGAIPSAHPVVIYTLLRVAVLVVVGGVLYLAQVQGVWLILFAFLISGVISAFVLSKPREGAAYGITSAFRNINARIDAGARAEDVDDDADFEATSSDQPHDTAPEKPTT